MAQVGKAAVYSVNGNVEFYGAAMATMKLVGAGVTDEFDVAELKDGTGEIIGAGASGRRRKATFEIIPYDASGVLTTSKLNIKLPEPLAKVTISNFGIDELDGDWNYIGGGQIALSPDGFVRVTLPCAKYESTPAFLSPVT